MELVTGYTLTSEDGVFVRLEETPEREAVILSLSRNGKVETASLNKEMLEAIMELRYKLNINRKEEAPI